ncbi:hypothetical protein OF83DRAFT_1288830 [Amylostereum chailletii]|nr:hypothetical protein OF83DRAFT_1288830 [Amylostereum chailletii]
MEANFLMNPSGRPGGWIGFDENLEHRIGELKAIFKSHGIASWEMLRTIAPGSPIWGALMKTFRSTLGVRQSGRHTKFDPSQLVQQVSEAVDEWNVLTVVTGRSAAKITPDARLVGIKLLNETAKNSQVTEFNKKRREFVEASLSSLADRDEAKLNDEQATAVVADEPMDTRDDDDDSDPVEDSLLVDEPEDVNVPTDC